MSTVVETSLLSLHEINDEFMVSREKSKVEQMFNTIAWRYDFLNHFLSLGIDVWWRKRAVARLPENENGNLLDVAVGTADLTITLLKKTRAGRITGIDISDEMMAIGRAKIARAGFADKTELLNGDCEALPFADNTFDAVTVSFGIRNFQHPQKALSEMHRVLKGGGQLLVLELSRSKNRVVRWLFELYFCHILPLIGRLISRGSKGAYSYLPKSVRTFVGGEKFAGWMTDAGFDQVECHSMTFGIVTIYVGTKKEITNCVN